MKNILMMMAVFSLIVQAATASPARVPGSGKNAERKLGFAEENIETINQYDFEAEKNLRTSGARGFFQFGTDSVTYTDSNKDKNQAYPYAKFEVFPWDDSNIYIDGKVAYRFDYNKAHGQSKETINNGYRNVWGQSNATYTDFNVGHIFKAGNFFLNYKMGYDNFNFQNTKLAYRKEFRFIPKASYTFNDSLSWYLKGYLGRVEVLEKPNVLNANSKNIKHKEYIHKLESGFTYTVYEDLAVTLGALNRTKEIYAGEYIEWMYIGKLDYNLYSTDNLQVRPYFWYLYTPEGQSGLNKSTPDQFDDEAGYRLGFTFDWQFGDSWALETDFGWYKFKKNSGSGTGTQGGTGNGGGSGSGSGTGNGGGSGSGSGTGNGGGSGSGSGTGNGGGSGSGSGTGNGGGSKSESRSSSSPARTYLDTFMVKVGVKYYF